MWSTDEFPIRYWSNKNPPLNVFHVLEKIIKWNILKYYQYRKRFNKKRRKQIELIYCNLREFKYHANYFYHYGSFIIYATDYGDRIRMFQFLLVSDISRNFTVNNEILIIISSVQLILVSLTWNCRTRDSNKI